MTNNRQTTKKKTQNKKHEMKNDQEETKMMPNTHKMTKKDAQN